MPRLALVAAATLVVGACETPPTGVPAVPGPDPSSLSAVTGDMRESAWGNARFDFGPNDVHYTFQAQRDEPTPTNPFAARGEARFHQRTAGVHGHIRIDCLRVVGREATLSGIVTRSSDPTIVGFEAVFSVIDGDVSGEPPRAPDFATSIKLHAVGTGSNCAIPEEFDFVPVDEGNVEVRPELM